VSHVHAMQADLFKIYTTYFINHPVAVQTNDRLILENRTYAEYLEVLLPRVNCQLTLFPNRLSSSRTRSVAG
jgi:hypothetical protein